MSEPALAPSPSSSFAGIRSTMETMRAARGRARRFWRLFDWSLVPMVLVDNHRRPLAANAAARLVTRLSLEEFLTRTIDDLTPPRMLWRMHESWRRLMRVGAVSGRYEVSFPDGGALEIVYGALANVLPGQHLIVFVPAGWPGDELQAVEEPSIERLDGPLSAREREILSLIAAGSAVEQIAEELTISAATVRTHTRNALRKLGVHSRAHAIAVAMREGMIEAPASEPAPLASSA